MPLSQDLSTERFRRSALSGAIFGTAENDVEDAFAYLNSWVCVLFPALFWDVTSLALARLKQKQPTTYSAR